MNKGNDPLTAFLAGCVMIPVTLGIIVAVLTVIPQLLIFVGVGLLVWVGLTVIRVWDEGEQ